MQPALHNRTQALSEGWPFNRSVLVTLRCAFNVNKDHTARMCCLTVNLHRIEQASREAFLKRQTWTANASTPLFSFLSPLKSVDNSARYADIASP